MAIVKKAIVSPTTNTKWEYETENLLGSGAHGRVYRGHASDGEPVAIKRIGISEFVDEDLQRARAREGDIGTVIAAANTVDTSCLLVPLDVVNHDGDLCVVMPLAERDLQAHINDGCPDSAEGAITILRDIATGLQQLQNLGILYRDLKPGNVLSVDGRWKLSDFSISRDLEAGTAPRTWHGAGTCEYMAPEVWRSEPKTAKSDLYALGIVAYQLITGGVPFLGPQTEDFRRQHLNDPVPALPPHGGIPRALDRLVTRLLRKSPNERPQDARAVLEALDGLQRPASGTQIALSAAAADSARISAAAESARLAQQSHSLAIDALYEQAASDLKELLYAAEELAQQNDPDTTLHSDGAQWHLRLESGRVTIVQWPWRSELTGMNTTEPYIAFAGAVYTLAAGAGPTGNIGFEFDPVQKRGSWKHLQFATKGRINRYGTEQQGFPLIQQQTITANGGFMVIRHDTYETGLTAEKILELLTESLAALSH